MLHIFRKYQRYIYLVVTVVIIISFSFFGTYSTLGSNTWREQLAFKAVNGDEITRSDVDDLTNFLATDNADKLAYGGAWGPNFLNDGVIRKDFLETGLAEELIYAYRDEFKDEWLRRADKEKRYNLYTHPQASFIGVEQIWNYIAPDMIKNYQDLRNSQDPTEQAAIKSRIDLFLAEKKNPSSALKRILRYQEQQFDWLTPDYALEGKDLSLFGYHTLNDWFSSNFTAMVSQFIINASLLAEAKGYEVSKAEALADLVRNTQVSYAENIKSPYLGVASPQEYFSEQLRLLNIDQGKAIKLWQQVMLFRRYFQDAGGSALVDTLAFKNFNQFANENVTVEVYHLPKDLHLDSHKALQNLEIYLAAVAPDSKNPASLPQNFLSAEKVKETFPELVQKRYALEVAQINQKALQSKIGIKELWNWETEDKNWDTLRKKFPQLGVASGKTVEERFEVLEDLSPNIRSRIDNFAQAAIIQTHPEWINQALDNAQVKNMVVGIRAKGNKLPFEGLDSPEKQAAFIALLDKAPIGQQPTPESALFAYTADDKVYYRIKVLDRSDKFEVLTFAEARQGSTLDELKERLLEKYYLANREENPSIYQEENKEWKPFQAVRELVADEYFAAVNKKIQAVKQKLGADDAAYNTLGKDQIAVLRFYPYLYQAEQQIAQDPAKQADYVKAEAKETGFDTLPASAPLKDQWKIEKEIVTLSRQDFNSILDLEEALALNVQDWSKLKPSLNGDLVFYQVKDKGMNEKAEIAIADQTRQAQSVLSSAAQRVLMQGVLEELKAKNAISLAYLKTPAEGENSQPVEDEMGRKE